MPFRWTFVGSPGRTVGEPVVMMGRIFPLDVSEVRLRRAQNVNRLWKVLTGRTNTLANNQPDPHQEPRVLLEPVQCVF